MMRRKRVKKLKLLQPNEAGTSFRSTLQFFNVLVFTISTSARFNALKRLVPLGLVLEENLAQETDRWHAMIEQLVVKVF